MKAIERLIVVFIVLFALWFVASYFVVAPYLTDKYVEGVISEGDVIAVNNDQGTYNLRVNSASANCLLPFCLITIYGDILLTKDNPRYTNGQTVSFKPDDSNAFPWFLRDVYVNVGDLVFTEEP